MPLTLPTVTPLMTAGTLLLPAAVEAVCEPWPLRSRGDRNSAGSASPPVVVPARAEHLVVAGDGLLLAGDALAVPLGGDVGRVGTGLGQRGEAGGLGPEPGVDHTDDDALTRLGRTAELLGPGAAGSGQPEERGGGDGVGLDDLVLPDVHDALGVREAGRLGVGEPGRVAVEGDGEVGHLVARGEPRPRQRLVVLAAEMLSVVLDRLPVGVELLALAGLGGCEPSDPTVVRPSGLARRLDDVQPCLARRGGRSGARAAVGCCRQRRRGEGDDGD